MRRLFLIPLGAAMMLPVVLSCTNLNIAGGSSSTDNGKILGVICDENSLPASKAQIVLRPADFDPCRDTVAPVFDTTDEAGDYEFSGLAQGMYAIEAVAWDRTNRALISSVRVDSGIAYAPVAALSRPGAIKVVSQEGFGPAIGYIYVPGTSRYSVVRSGVGFIDSIPAGPISALNYVNPSDPASNRTLKKGFTLEAGATRVIADYSAWKYSKRLFLNTTMSGADVSGTVLNFPVLVRLSGSNFDFSQANGDGSDLRFKKPDDSPLAYEIERWDPGTELAEVWVKVDTVYGNDSTHFFTMHWGNSSATAESNSTAVFDTTAGFQGVWHLSGEGTTTAHDATPNRYNGTPNAATTVEGAIGTARGFNGLSSYITMPNTAASRLNFAENGIYSMSLWVYADTIDTIWHAIAGKGHEQYYMQLKGLGKNRATWEFVEFHDQRGWEYTEDSTPPAPGAKQWLYLVGVRSGGSQWLYINGERVVDTAKLMPGSYDRNTGDNFTVGRYGHSVTIPYYQGWSYFKGRIDELRVSRGAITADWIRLCYMNQKADDALIMFEQ